MISLWLLVSFDLLNLVRCESQVATFRDGSCQSSQKYFAAVNGYPDGACMNIATASDSGYGSFMVTSLDPECAVTIYGKNTNSLSCSASVLEVAEPTSCYNSSWIYLSVDGCTKPSTLTNISSTPSNTSTAGDLSTTSTGHKSHAGVIAGGVFGGVAGIAVLLGAVYIGYRRRHSKELGGAEQLKLKMDNSKRATISELSPCSQVHELEHPEKLLEAPTGRERVERAISVAIELEAPQDIGSDAHFSGK